jgi:2-(1,2-epoxy-1,2-dihydrophenyl)acetyl-CoA isomerase
MQSSDDCVVLEKQGAISTIIFNRPQSLNAISAELANSFLDCCRRVAADEECRALVIQAAGRAFMAGGDLRSFYHDFDQAAATAESMIVPMNEALTLLASLPVPVVAVLHGHVAGAGMGVAMACDLAIASSDTLFSFSYSDIGASPDVGLSWALPRIVGLRRALGIAMLADTLSAEQALQLGMVNRVVDKDALEAATRQLVNRLASGPTIAYAETKRLMRSSFDRELNEQLREELQAFQRCARTRDFVTGVSSFMEKRKSPPVFGGF